jgi:hypothetical protein
MGVRTDRIESEDTNQRSPLVAEVEIRPSSLRLASFEDFAGPPPFARIVRGTSHGISGPEESFTTFAPTKSLLKRWRLSRQVQSAATAHERSPLTP